MSINYSIKYCRCVVNWLSYEVLKKSSNSENFSSLIKPNHVTKSDFDSVVFQSNALFFDVQRKHLAALSRTTIQPNHRPWLNEMVYTNHVTTSARHSKINDM